MIFFAFALPLHKKELQKLNMPGVYFFIKEDVLLPAMAVPHNFTAPELEKVTPLYIGKAKSLKQRLLSYRIFSTQKKPAPLVKMSPMSKRTLFSYKDADTVVSQTHEEVKKNRLGIICKTLVVGITQSHFEACLEEINYIKIFSPLFNKKIKATPRSFYLQVDLNSLSLFKSRDKKLIQSKKRPQLIVGDIKKLSLNFSTLVSVIKVLEKKLKLILYQFESYGIKKNYTYAVAADFSVSTEHGFSYCLQHEVKRLLSGKNNKITRHIYKDMLGASLNEEYREAARLRDLYFHLKSLQRMILKSKMMWKNYRRGTMAVENEGVVSQFNFKFLDKKEFIYNYEKLLLVSLWVKKNWENCRWEILT